jgi:tetratricopeptide (TPR) repeat protein
MSATSTLKQGRIQEAIKAYHRAIELNRDPKRAAELYRKLARAYLTVDPNDEQFEQVEANLKQAERNMQQALEAYKKVVAAPQSPAAANAARGHVGLPGKLIISAKKRLVDQVGSGKISFEEFRRQASVEHLPFGPRSGKQDSSSSLHE